MLFIVLFNFSLKTLIIKVDIYIHIHIHIYMPHFIERKLQMKSGILVIIL